MGAAVPLGLASSPRARRDEPLCPSSSRLAEPACLFNTAWALLYPQEFCLVKTFFILTWPKLKLWGKHHPSRPLHWKHVAHPGSTWHLPAEFLLVGEKCNASIPLLCWPESLASDHCVSCQQQTSDVYEESRELLKGSEQAWESWLAGQVGAASVSVVPSRP